MKSTGRRIALTIAALGVAAFTVGAPIAAASPGSGSAQPGQQAPPKPEGGDGEHEPGEPCGNQGHYEWHYETHYGWGWQLDCKQP